jgi:hypothetical protein
MDTPAVIIYRLCIAFLYQKALCVLHYPYMILARTIVAMHTLVPCALKLH